MSSAALHLEEADEPDAAEMAEAHAALKLAREKELTRQSEDERHQGQAGNAAATAAADAAAAAAADTTADATADTTADTTTSTTTTTAEAREPPRSERRSTDAAAAAAAAAAADNELRRGMLLKCSRRHGDERPWKRRYFVLVSSTLMYYHASDYSDVPQLLLGLPLGTRVAQCAAPRGFGLRIASPLQAVRVAAETEAERDAWQAALTAAVGLPEVPLPISAEDEAAAAAAAAAVASSGLYKLKAALASAFATSRLGKHLIKRYLDEAGRLLIRTVVDFVAVESGAKQAARIETYVFDLASRIAVIMHANALPATVNLSQLQDDTITFCQEFMRFSRDRRLQAQRALYANAAPSVLEPDLLLRSGTAVAAAWRSILEPTVPAKALKRFDAVVGHIFEEKQFRALLDDAAHRERMATIERSLRELLETY